MESSILLNTSAPTVYDASSTEGGSAMPESSELPAVEPDFSPYTLAMFEADVRSHLDSAGIEVQVEELHDGTRTVVAWARSAPEETATFPIDQVRIMRYQAHIVASVIRGHFQPAPETELSDR